MELIMHKALIRISIMILIFMIGIKDIYSQEKEKSFTISIGAENLKIRNNNFSPMTYSGFPLYTAIGFLTETPNYKDDLYIQFQKGEIQSATGNIVEGSEAKLIGGHISWGHLNKLNRYSTPEYCFYLGGVLNSSFTFYKRNYYGADSYYLFQSSLGPSFCFTHPFTIMNKNIIFDNQFSFALLSYAVYPSYSSPMTDRLLNKDMNDISAIDYLTGGKILAINKFQYVNYMAGFVYELNNKLALKLSYNWELINIIRENNLTIVNHNIFLSLIIK